MSFTVSRSWLVAPDRTSEPRVAPGLEPDLDDGVVHVEAAQALAHIGTWHFDVETGTYEWSDELYRIFGLDPNVSPEGRTRAYREAVPPEARSEMRRLVQRATVEGGSFMTDHTLHLPSGETAYTVVHGDVVRDGDERIVRVWGTMQDVSGMGGAGFSVGFGSGITGVGDGFGSGSGMIGAGSYGRSGPGRGTTIGPGSPIETVSVGVGRTLGPKDARTGVAG